MTPPSGSPAAAPALRIGVTGHRRLADPGAVAAVVRSALHREIPRAAGLSALPAVRILSCLAEGADRLVAQVMLEAPTATLSVVLPLAPAEYSAAFEGPSSRQEFDELLRQDPDPVCLHPRPLAEEFPGLDAASARQIAYRNAGRHVVDRCDVLIAVWDGKPARGPGGTAEIVTYALERGRPVVHIRPDAPGAVTVLAGRLAETSAAATSAPPAGAAVTGGAHPVPRRVLFLCSQNKLRSPTAERVFRGTPGLDVRSAGLDADAVVPLTRELLEWADLVLVMEKRHRNLIQKRFKDLYRTRRIVCLHIPDEFEFMDEGLVRLLRERAGPLINPPPGHF